jgi:hypothetical protein
MRAHREPCGAPNSRVADAPVTSPREVIPMTLILPILILVILGLAIRYGSDSRDGRDWAAGPRTTSVPRDIVLR